VGSSEHLHRPEFSAVVEQRDEIVFVRVRGELDLATAPDLRTAIDLGLRAAPSAIVLDIEGVTFMDLSGLRALHDGEARAARAGRSFSVQSPQPNVRRLFELTSTQRLLHEASPGA
jgi:anti-sigma B factor antagonist